MVAFVVRRLVGMLITLVLISIISFVVIQLPPGDVITSFVRQQEAVAGTALPPETIELLRMRYGFGEPMHIQYIKWITGFVQGDMGISVVYGDAPVSDLIGRRIGLTLFLVFSTLIISWGLAIPLGIYAATHKNQFTDYLFSGISFVGISVPDFLLAIIYLWITVFVLHSNYSGGLFSPQYQDAPWSWERVVDLMKHLPVPMLILGLGSTAGTFRVMRANLLDVLDQQFVETARAKGLSERVVIYKHAVRIAINPLISRLGMHLPALLGGAVIISIVLDLPTLGPPFIRALRDQDMFLAGAILMILAATLLVGNFVADILLAISDPRIQYD